MSLDKLVDSTQLDADLTIVANAIRTKGGTSAQLSFPTDFVTAIGAIPSGGTYQAKTNISPATSSQTIYPDTGYDALSSVQINAMPSGTAGTPTATKGTVSNHSVSVTPSVTNTTGYITGSTKTGTAVTVSASELVSGSETKTANGTYDVTNLAELVVNVSGGGGASNVVKGSFIALSSEKGTAKSITLNYTGNGYPVFVNIYPSEGSYNSDGDLYKTLQRYAVVTCTIIKSYLTGTHATPVYSGSAKKDYGLIIGRYKNSSSSASSVSTGATNDAAIYNNAAATGTGFSAIVKIISKTQMSIFIANTNYGFKYGIEYSYVVYYSS